LLEVYIGVYIGVYRASLVRVRPIDRKQKTIKEFVMFLSEKAVRKEEIEMELDILAFANGGRSPVFTMPIQEYAQVCLGLGITSEIKSVSAFSRDVIRMGIRHSGSVRHDGTCTPDNKFGIPRSTWVQYRKIFEGKAVAKKCQWKQLDNFVQATGGKGKSKLAQFWESLIKEHMPVLNSSILGIQVLKIEEPDCQDFFKALAVVDAKSFRVGFREALETSTSFLDSRDYKRLLDINTITEVALFASRTQSTGISECLKDMEQAMEVTKITGTTCSLLGYFPISQGNQLYSLWIKDIKKSERKKSALKIITASGMECARYFTDIKRRRGIFDSINSDLAPKI